MFITILKAFALMIQPTFGAEYLLGVLNYYNGKSLSEIINLEYDAMKAVKQLVH